MTERRLLPAAHANSLASAMGQALEFVALARQRLEEDGGSGAPVFSRETSERLRSLLARIEERARLLEQGVAAPRHKPTLRAELRGLSSVLWSNLVDSESGPMRRYGAPPVWYADEIDPLLEEMQDAAQEILYLSAEPKDED